MLVQHDQLAGGSMSCFVSGKHYNSCNRLHPLPALAFQILHFEQFCVKTEIADVVERFVEESISTESLSVLEESPLMKHL